MKPLLSLLLLMAVSLRPAVAATYYVAKSGNDSNPGTLASPFLTIQHAASLMVAGDTCYIRQGTYREEVVPANSGASGAPITFTNYPNELVVVSGADVLTGTWGLYSGSIYSTPVSNTTFRQLFVDGDMMNEARWPNAQTDNLLGQQRSSVQSATSTSLTDTNLPTANLVGGYVHVFAGTAGGEWAAYTRQITGYDQTTKTLTWANAITTSTVNAGNPYYVYGSLDLLDIPTEWYLDATSGTLFLWAPDGALPATHTVEIKTRVSAFTLDNLSYVDVTGLYVFAAGISMINTTNCVVDQCNLKYVQHSTSADWDDRTLPMSCTVSGTGSRWQNSTIDFSAQDGIYLGGANGVVTNCVIANVDYYPGYYYASVQTDPSGSGPSITHNTLVNSGRFLVSPGTHATEVGYNDVSWGDRLLRDGGGIYVYGMNGAGSSIDHNWCHNTEVGIYVDNGCSNFTVQRNVCYNNSHYGIQINSPSTSNLFYNNTLIGNPTSIPTPYGKGTLSESGTQVINTLADASMSFLSDCTHSNNGWYPPVGSDFVPQSGSGAINGGLVIPGYTAASNVTIGCYQVGDPYWTPGASISIPPFPTPDSTTVPAAPTGLSGTRTGSVVNLTWVASASLVSCYNVERSTAPGGPYTTVGTVLAGTFFTDSVPLDGKTYYYVVQAVNSTGTSANSNEVSFATEHLLSLNQPVTASSYQTGNVPSNGNDGSQTTRWAASGGTYPQWWRVDLGTAQPLQSVQTAWYNSTTSPRAYQYTIDVSNDDVSYTTVVSNTANTVQGTTNDTLPGGTSARYVRVTVTGSTIATAYAGFYECSVFGAVTQPPTGLTATAASSSQINLAWTATSGATSYNVLRSTTNGGPYSTVTTGVTSTSYSDTGLTALTTYYYVVQAVSSYGTSSDSSPASATTQAALLSQGQPATASSSETGDGPTLADDGSLSTRWAAVDGTYPQWWRVDLGASHTLTQVQIDWYSASTRSYKYAIDVSNDDVTYTTVVDQTGRTATGNSSDSFSATGRYVRVRVTGTSGGWASFYECQVFGH